MSNLQTLSAEELVTASGGDSKTAAAAGIAGAEGAIAGRLTSGTRGCGRSAHALSPIRAAARSPSVFVVRGYAPTIRLIASNT
jgi:hypothetical protein